jgi:hypothetical protein
MQSEKFYPKASEVRIRVQYGGKEITLIYDRDTLEATTDLMLGETIRMAMNTLGVSDSGSLPSQSPST